MNKTSTQQEQPWKIDPSIDVDRVSLEDVKLIFSQAEKRLDDTVKTGESIASKTMSMITLMAGVLIALSGFIISDWKGIAKATHKDYVAIIGVLYIFSLFVYVINNVLPSKYFVLGSEPEELMIPQFFDLAVQKDKITIFIYMSEIENYNLRIKKNLKANTSRWERYRLSVISFLILPVVLGIAYLICEYTGVKG
jgi:hypothetical protein